MIDVILQPFVKKTEICLKDSQNLIQKSKDLKFESDCKVYSCDFESLYSNINQNKALEIIVDFICNSLNSIHITIEAFACFLKLILINNYFSFNNLYYKQIQGIAMGSKCGPSIANIFCLLSRN